jgi:membrane associated rhomboid family serine protease
MSYPTRAFNFGSTITPTVKRLMIANGAIFAVTLVLGREFTYDWFAFQPARIFIRPWGVFTYMFIHGGLWHVAMNMLMLFFFGSPLESRWGGSEFLKFYFICGLGGVALSYLFLPAAVIGASAAVYGVMLAYAMNWPEARIYVFGIFPVAAKWLVAFMFMLSLLSAVDGSGGGVAHLAHLGGLVTGFLYLKSDWRFSERFSRARNAGRRRRMAIVPGADGQQAGAESARRPKQDQPRADAALYDAVDQVLDKISATGMSSLTDAERRLLDEVSRRHRSN